MDKLKPCLGCWRDLQMMTGVPIHYFISTCPEHKDKFNKDHADREAAYILRDQLDKNKN